MLPHLSHTFSSGPPPDWSSKNARKCSQNCLILLVLFIILFNTSTSYDWHDNASRSETLSSNSTPCLALFSQSRYTRLCHPVHHASFGWGVVWHCLHSSSLAAGHVFLCVDASGFVFTQALGLYTAFPIKTVKIRQAPWCMAHMWRKKSHFKVAFSVGHQCPLQFGFTHKIHWGQHTFLVKPEVSCKIQWAI